MLHVTVSGRGAIGGKGGKGHTLRVESLPELAALPPPSPPPPSPLDMDRASTLPVWPVRFLR